MASRSGRVTGKDFNPGQARWCEEHHRLECTKLRNKGDRVHCHRSAMRGLPHCDWHSGMNRELASAKGDAMVTAWSAVGEQIVDHKMAVLGTLNMTWLRLQVYSEALRKQVEAGGITEEQAAADGIDVKGLIGFKMGMGGSEGTLYVQGEEIRALVKLEAEERDRVVRYAEVAQRMGINDRLISLAERWGDVVALRVSLMLDELGLTEQQQAALPALLTAHLSALDLSQAMAIEGEVVKDKR